VRRLTLIRSRPVATRAGRASRDHRCFDRSTATLRVRLVTQMKFALVMATINRTGELERFLKPLAAQTHRDFELVVVDQNRDDRLLPVLRPYQQQFSIKHMRGCRPGISRARNAGLKALSDDVDIVAFPDDDCWYPRNLLRQLTDDFSSDARISGLSGICMTTYGTPRGRWAKRPRPITRYSIFGRCISFTMFLRKSLVVKVGDFDEALGLGPETPFPGAEDYDYLLRAASASPASAVLYAPSIKVFHDDLPSVFDEKTTLRRYGDARGFGHFLHKHHYSAAFVGYYTARYLADAAFCLIKGDRPKAKYRWTALAGTFNGWFDKSADAVASDGPIANVEPQNIARPR